VPLERSPLTWLVALLLPVLAGCAADGTDLEALPFYAEDRAGIKGTVARTIPPMLGFVDKQPATRKEEGKPGATQTKVGVLSPLIRYWGEGEEHDFYLFGIGATTSTFLHAGPLGRGVIGDLGTAFTKPSSVFPSATPGGLALFPFVGYDREHVDPQKPDETKRDFGAFPLFMAGEWADKGKYAAIAPFGGKTYGLLGREEITWYGFPYPFYMHVRDSDYESRHVLWPFVNWVEGQRHEGFRVLPFYAHYRKWDTADRVSYDRTWIMWPFFTTQKNSAGQGETDDEGLFHPAETDIFFLFPFYGRVSGPDTSTTSVLWPLFKFESSDPGPREHYWELRAPFPVFIIHHGVKEIDGGEPAERLRVDVWPLGGWRERPGYLRHFFIWPIERYEARDDKWCEDYKFYFLPLLEYHWRLEKQSQETTSKVRAWPFFVYRRGARGDVYFHTIEPILWDDPDGLERSLFAFLRLYEYRSNELGGWSHRALFGLFSLRSEPETPTRPSYDRLSVLFGLFQYRNAGGERGLRFLWLPEMITWGSKPE
jgi:hypothetical protein